MMQDTNYRNILNSILEQRCSVNKNYSQRAFARDLGLSSSNLNEILNGKKGLSELRAIKICQKLGFSNEETSYFCNLVSESDARSKYKRIIASENLKKFRQKTKQFNTLNLDFFNIISDWYHYAILELIKTNNFIYDYSWIAKRLNINISQVKMAITRLKRLELIKEKNGRVVLTNSSNTTPEDIPSEAIRKFHKQMLDKATEAISLQSVMERDISNLTIAINTKYYKEIKTKIKNFVNEINDYVEFSSDHKTKDQVYSLGMQFFRLSEKEN